MTDEMREKEIDGLIDKVRSAHTPDDVLEREKSGLREKVEEIIYDVIETDDDGRVKGKFKAVDKLLALIEPLQKSLDDLHGAKFSDRCYHALKSRAEKAEAELDALRKENERLRKTLDWTKTERDAEADGVDELSADVQRLKAENAELKKRLEKNPGIPGKNEANNG